MKPIYTNTTPPFLHVLIKRDREPASDWSILGPHTHVYNINGANCSTTSSCYEELSRAFSFPNYQGKNLNALLDSLQDGDIIHGNPILIFIDDAKYFLCAESTDSLDGFLDTFQLAAKRWSEGLSWPWNFGPTPLHVIFCFDDISDVQRFNFIKDESKN